MHLPLVLFLPLVAAIPVLCGAGTPCRSQDCAQLGATLTLNMNLSADPCDNFYEFACGGFRQRFRYSADDPSGKPYTDASVHMSMEMENRLFELLIDDSQFTPRDGTVRLAAELARAAFNNCVIWGEAKFADYQSSDDVQRLAAVRHFNSLLGSLIGGRQRPSSLEQLLARAASMGFTTVFGLVLPNELPTQLPAEVASLTLNATKIVISVNTFNYSTDASLWLPMLKLLTSENATLSGQLFGPLSMNPEGAMKSVASEVTRIVEAHVNSTLSFHGSIEELHAELGRNATTLQFNWLAFVQELVPERVDPGTVVAVDNFLLLKALLSYFVATPVLKDVSCNSVKCSCQPAFTDRSAFLILDAMLELSDLLPVSLKDGRPVKKTPLATLMTTQPLKNRRQCLEAAHKMFEPVTEWLYRRHFFRGDFAEVERVIGEVKEATIAGMREQAWISAADQAKMIDKVKSMRHYIGHRELSQDQVARFYTEIVAQFNRSQSGDLGHVLTLSLKAYARRHLEIMASDRAPSPFLFESPLVVNAFNDLESNSLVFPLGILTPPVYNPGYPDFALYGGLASLVGHEIAHGFADQWFKTQDAGLLQLEAATEAAYMRRARCVRDEFANLTVAPYRPLDVGNATLADDISDVAGLRSAHRAFEAAAAATRRRRRPGRQDEDEGVRLTACAVDRSPEQLFFVHAAQIFCTKATPDAVDELFRRDPTTSHSPGPTRINGMVRNSPEFARAYSCPLGSPMNPVGKCIFW